MTATESAFPMSMDTYRETSCGSGLTKRQVAALAMMAQMVGPVYEQKIKPQEAAKWALECTDALLAMW